MSTLIPFHIPTDVKVAILKITAQDGSLVKQLDIKERGAGEVEVNLEGSGNYFYSLILDGKSIATKKMVVVNQ